MEAVQQPFRIPLLHFLSGTQMRRGILRLTSRLVRTASLHQARMSPTFSPLILLTLCSGRLAQLLQSTDNACSWLNPVVLIFQL